ELHRDLALRTSEIDLHTGLEAVRKAVSDLCQTRSRGHATLGGARGVNAVSDVPHSHNFLQGTHADPLSNNALSEPVLDDTVLDAQQCACVTSRNHACCHSALNRGT